MSIVATVAVADLTLVNATLEAQGFGPNNFSVPAYGATGATHTALHCWDSPRFLAALQAIPEVTVTTGADDPIGLTAAAIADAGAAWGDRAPELPSSGTVTAGSHYRYEDSVWYVIQSFDRSVYGEPPETYPALIRRLRDPRRVEPWRQPIDQYDAYKLVNPFTGYPDKCTYEGQTWRVSQADGAGNNVWAPNVYGWVVD